MLEVLRQNTRSWIIYLLFSIIIVVFVFTFNTITPDQACGSAGPLSISDLCQVGGETIDTNLLQMAQSVTIDPPSPGSKDFQSQQRGFAYRTSRFVLPGSVQYSWSDFGPDPSSTSPIKLEKAMHTLVETLLVSQQAERMGLSVSDEELTDWLITSYWFDPDTGEFQRKAYDNTIRYQIGTSPSRWERFAKQELLREKLITILVGGLDVTEAELAFHHGTTKETVDLATIIVDDRAAADLIQIADAEVTTWLAKGQEQVGKYYEDNPDEFKKPERIVVRGIQVRAPNAGAIEGETDATIKAQLQTERDTARTRADGILIELQAASAAPAPPPALADDAPPADGEAPPAAPAADVVSVEAFTAAVTTHSDHSGTKDTGGLFDKARSREEMGRFPFGPAAADAAFGLAAGKISGVSEVPGGFWILRLDSKVAASERSLDDARLDIAEQLMKKERAAEFKGALADEVLAEAKKDGKKPLADVATIINVKYGVTAPGAGLAVSETGAFSRLQPGAFGPAVQLGRVPGVGEAADLVAAAFAATEEAPLLGAVYPVAEGERLVVAQRVAHEAAPEIDDEARGQIRDRLLREKQKLLYRSWYDGLLAQALAEGDVEFSSDWSALLADAQRTFVESGGRLPSAEPASEDDAASAEGAAGTQAASAASE